RAARTPAALAGALGDLEAELAERRAGIDRADDEGLECAGGGGGGLAAAPGGPPSALEDLATVVALAREFTRLDPGGAGPALVGWLRAAGADGDGSGDAVDVCTFHAAKGLEWPVVVVTGLEQGLVPLARADAAGRREEVRLLYVAIT